MIILQLLFMLRLTTKGFKMIILIDDERSFINSNGERVIRTLHEAIEWLESSPTEIVEQLWLDHDLGLYENEVTEIIPFVNLLEEKAYFGQAPTINTIIVHTSNSIGGNRIVSALDRYFNVKRVYAGDYLKAKDE